MVTHLFFKKDKTSRFVLLFGDLVALLLFVYAGQRSHNMTDLSQPFLRLLATGGEFALPWIMAGIWLGAFPDAIKIGLPSLMNLTLKTWLIAAPLGILLRAYVLDRAVIPPGFMVATLGFGGLFLFGWRLLFWWGWKKYHNRLF